MSEYKGMKNEELAAIRAEQEKQRKMKEEGQDRLKHDSVEYDQYQKDVLEMQNMLEQKKQDIIKEQTRMQFKVNELLVQQKKYDLLLYWIVIDICRIEAEYGIAAKKIYEEQPFFSTFNKSSR